jgi:hypothetical protein
MSDHSPEPWKVQEIGRYVRIVSQDGMVTSDNSFTPTGHEDAARIVACVNFCREFDTEFLEGRRLKRLTAEDEVRVAADIDGFDGFVAVALLPVVKE